MVAGSGIAAGQELGSAERIVFDIPSQPLMSALESYGAAAKREVLYDAQLATGRVSGDVKGAFAPSEALQILLAGTGLVGRLASRNAVVVVPSPVVRKTVPAGDADRADPVIRARYYGMVQERIRYAFCNNAMLRPGHYRMAVRFWIAPSGAVQQIRLLSKTGDGHTDSAIEATLRGLRIGEVPPPGVSQPLTMVVLPRLSAQTQDCAAVDAVKGADAANPAGSAR